MQQAVLSQSSTSLERLQQSLDEERSANKAAGDDAASKEASAGAAATAAQAATESVRLKEIQVPGHALSAILDTAVSLCIISKSVLVAVCVLRSLTNRSYIH